MPLLTSYALSVPVMLALLVKGRVATCMISADRSWADRREAPNLVFCDQITMDQPLLTQDESGTMYRTSLEA